MHNVKTQIKLRKSTTTLLFHKIGDPTVHQPPNFYFEQKIHPNKEPTKLYTQGITPEQCQQALAIKRAPPNLYPQNYNEYDKQNFYSKPRSPNDYSPFDNLKLCKRYNLII